MTLGDKTARRQFTISTASDLFTLLNVSLGLLFKI